MAKKNPAKTWVFTDYDMKNLAMYKTWENDCTRMTVSEEICPTTKKLHLQGRVTFRRAKRMASLKKACPKVHWEVAKSDCFIYEKKDGSKIKIEIDNRAPGARSDIKEGLAAVAGGASKREMWNNHQVFMIKYGKSYNEARSNLYKKAKVGDTRHQEIYFERPDLEEISKTQVVVFMGESGIGKTTAMKQWLKQVPYLLVKEVDDLKNFDESEHKAIVFDDFNAQGLSRESKLALFEQEDETTIRCRYENAFIPEMTIKIILCNKAWWDMDDPAFRRRTYWVTENDAVQYPAKHRVNARTPNPPFNLDSDDDDFV